MRKKIKGIWYKRNFILSSSSWIKGESEILTINPCQGGFRASICVVHLSLQHCRREFEFWIGTLRNQAIISILISTRVQRLIGSPSRSLDFQRFIVENVQIGRPIMCPKHASRSDPLHYCWLIFRIAQVRISRRIFSH